MKRDDDFDRGWPLYWCPYCDLLQPGWLCEIQRAAHVVRYHPECSIPEGDGLKRL